MEEKKKTWEKYGKKWEEYLEKDNKKYKKKWQALSKRFWKKELLSLFESWNENLTNRKTKVENNFKDIFNKQIGNKLKQNKWIRFMDKDKTYSPLMSLFGKFRHFYKKYSQTIFNNLSENVWWPKETQKETQKNIYLNLDGVPKEEQINSWEKLYMKVTAGWNIVAPWDSKEDRDDDPFLAEQQKTTKKKSKKNKKKAKKSNQIEIPFDEI